MSNMSNMNDIKMNDINEEDDQGKRGSRLRKMIMLMMKNDMNMFQWCRVFQWCCRFLKHVFIHSWSCSEQIVYLHLFSETEENISTTVLWLRYPRSANQVRSCNFQEKPICKFEKHLENFKKNISLYL